MYPGLAQHPVNRLYTAKVPLNINTDCRTISNTTLSREYFRLVSQFHWKAADFLACNLAAVDHAFTTPDIKAQLRSRLKAAYSR
jgi:adenosine deaminase